MEKLRIKKNIKWNGNGMENLPLKQSFFFRTVVCEFAHEKFFFLEKKNVGFDRTNNIFLSSYGYHCTIIPNNLFFSFLSVENDYSGFRFKIRLFLGFFLGVPPKFLRFTGGFSLKFRYFRGISPRPRCGGGGGPLRGRRLKPIAAAAARR